MAKTATTKTVQNIREDLARPKRKKTKLKAKTKRK